MKTKCGTDILVCVGCRRCFVAIAMVLAAMTAGIAQHQHPATTPEKPVALLAGLGSWRHPIATRNAEAQKFFDQGLTLVYGFNRPEALRSFRKVVELDGSAAMAYWGIAMALERAVPILATPAGTCGRCGSWRTSIPTIRMRRRYMRKVYCCRRDGTG